MVSVWEDRDTTHTTTEYQYEEYHEDDVPLMSTSSDFIYSTDISNEISTDNCTANLPGAVNDDYKYHKDDVSLMSTSSDFIYSTDISNEISTDNCTAILPVAVNDDYKYHKDDVSHCTTILPVAVNDYNIQSPNYSIQSLIDDSAYNETTTVLNNTKTPEDDITHISMYLPTLQDTHATVIGTHPIVDDISMISSNDNILEECATEASDTDEEQTRAIDGGYDYKFLRKFKKIEDDDLVCPICHLVCREPQQSECCGKVFCNICVTKLKQSDYVYMVHNNNPSCPNCRSEPLQCFTDKRSNRSILNLKVSCKRLKKGCKWQGTLQEAERHSEDCDYRVIVCSNRCQKKIYRHKLKRHLLDFCPKRQYKCSLCQEHGEWAHITGEHKHVCPDELLYCHNRGCKEITKRCLFHNHQSVCPKKILCCTFADLGCKTTCTREKMQQHNDQFVHHHLTCAVNVARSQDVPKMDHLLQVAPVILRLHNVSESKHLKSQPFLSFVNGYKMCLVLNDFVEYLLCLMPGKHGKIQRRPFCDKITVTLLNQTNDSGHHEMKNNFAYWTKWQTFECARDEEYSQVFTIGKFSIPELTSLKDPLHILQERGYLVNDTVCLSVEYKRY